MAQASAIAAAGHPNAKDIWDHDAGLNKTPAMPPKARLAEMF